MICHEFKNIEKLETNKVTRASETSTVSSLNKFLLNVLSDQVETPTDFVS